MFLKALEIQGFKSFPDKTILAFDTKMTAVVGSNGNGKSNISDALRWVMGEQGAKTLRGDKMEDVIFHGTESRNQMGYAKVALSIDNTDRALSVNSDEVIITRKLYRTGDSEYLINGTKSRLKDIHELLMGTGLGRDGYSIIGQGRVADIVNSKGKDRREIFDEAAGVSKFLHKKAESERELQRANDNILRLLDIHKELEDRLPVLEKQSEKAKKAYELMESEKKLDISVSVYELRRISRDMVEIQNSILMNEGELEHFEREIKNLEDENETLTREKVKLSLELDECRNLNENSRNQITEIEKKILISENEIIHNNGRIEAVKSQIENSKKSESEFEQQINAFREQLDENERKIINLNTEIGIKNKKLSEKSEENSLLDDDYKALERQLSGLYGKKTEAEITIKQAENNLLDLENSLSETKEQIESGDEALADYRIKRREIKTSLEKTEEKKREFENKLDGYNKLYESKREKLSESHDLLEKMRRDRDFKKSRFDVLSDIERNMTGYFPSVKAIMTANKVGKLSDIYGTIADIIHIEKKYALAIETALGNALQNIIVKNEETAKRAIRFLKETNAGRATFLPLTSVKGSTLNFPELYNEEGFVGFGHEVVKCDEKFENIIKSVLARTVIIEDIDTATFIAKKYGYKFRIVTLDAQIINAGGSFTGGSVKANEGIITRKQEIEELNASLIKINDTLSLAKSSYSELSAEVNKFALETEGLREEINKTTNEITKLTAELGGINNLIKQCENNQDNSQMIIDKHESQKAAQQKVIDDYKKIISEIEQQLAEKDSDAKEADEKLKKESEKLRKISDEITELSMKVMEAKKDSENIKHRINDTEKNKENLKISSHELLAEIELLNEKNKTFIEEIEQKKQESEKISSSFSENQDKIKEVVEKINSAEKRMAELNGDIREKIEDKEKFSNALVLATERKKNAQTSEDNIKSSLWDKYEMTLTEAKNIAEEPENLQEAKNELTSLRRKISALGSVNFAAIEEYIDVEARYTELSKQLKDVENSKAELEKLIMNLTADIKARFLTSFNEINSHFGRIFSEIFGGGKAHLELTNPDDILGSDIEIFAAPPGKLVKNLISLSGGEQTMVAITIYFAILLHRPTPFCMLDEVDAALDEVNIQKYVTYLRRFSKNTQLMIITHRRGTIEGCDILYGVYMQEKGVSKLLRQEIIDNLDIDIDD